jgi:hypothetical protein
LQAEMRIDMQRIWKRNLGRDDRCMADLGKEVNTKLSTCCTILSGTETDYNKFCRISLLSASDRLLAIFFSRRPGSHFWMKK